MVVFFLLGRWNCLIDRAARIQTAARKISRRSHRTGGGVKPVGDTERKTRCDRTRAPSGLSIPGSCSRSFLVTSHHLRHRAWISCRVAARPGVCRLLKNVKVTECPPEEREDKYRGQAPAAELLRAPTRRHPS